VNEGGTGADAGAARRAARPYSIAVGVLFLGALIFAGLNTLNSKPIGLAAGDHLPRFAAPSATGTVNKDANVSQKEACNVPVHDAVRICDYFDRPLVLVVWFTKGCNTCRRQLDAIQAAQSRFPAVAFVGLDVRDSLENAGKEVRKHGWRFPMALDRDGAVSGLYGVGGGPTIFFAYPKGVLMSKTLGELDDAALARKVEALVAGSRKRRSAQQG
jgi:peroxiredoxin